MRPSKSSAGQFPAVRMRRNRQSPWSRRLNAENELSTSDLIWPVFVADGVGRKEPVESMPGVNRLSVDLIAETAEEAVRLGIPAMALFPYTDPEKRTEDGAEAYNPENLVCRATRAVRIIRGLRRLPHHGGTTGGRLLNGHCTGRPPDRPPNRPARHQ